MKLLRSSRVLPANQALAWKVLSDIERWPEWNPTIPKVEGRLALDARVRAWFALGARRVSFPAQVFWVDAPHGFAWRGGPSGIFRGEHHFELHPINETSCRIDHWERFTGLATPLMPDLIRRRVERSYERMNDALARELEAVRQRAS